MIVCDIDFLIVMGRRLSGTDHFMARNRHMKV